MRSLLSLAVGVALTGSASLHLSRAATAPLGAINARYVALLSGEGELRIGAASQRIRAPFEIRFDADCHISFKATKAAELLLSSIPFMPGQWGAPHPVVVVLTTTGTNTWTVPNDWNSGNNKVEAIGGGGSGKGGNKGSVGGNGFGGSGGGGGAYCFATNVSLTPGGTASYTIGAGATANSAGGTSGGDTTFKDSGTLLAKAGTSGGSGNSPGVGGAAASCTPSANAFSGGAGGASVSAGNTSGGGGGGAGGPTAAGNAGANASGTTGGAGGQGDDALGGAGGAAGVGVNGGNAAAGTEIYNATYGSGGGAGAGGATGGDGSNAGTAALYGGGGGGGAGGAADPCSGFGGGTGSAGRQGLIIIRYTTTF